MKCEEFEDFLNQLLDQRRRPEWDPSVRLHCDTCAECRELAASYGVLLEGFYQLATPEPPADLAVRVVDECRRSPSTSRRVTLAATLLATAAAALFVIPLFRSVRDRSGDVGGSSARPVALASSRTGESPAAAWKEIDELPVVGSVLVSLSDDDETTDPYAALAKGTGQGLASVVLYMPNIGSTPGRIAPRVIRGEPFWPGSMGESLKPVADSVSETLNLLLEPMTEAGGRS